MTTPLLSLIGEKQSNAGLYVVIGCMTLIYLAAQYREAKRREVRVNGSAMCGRWHFSFMTLNHVATHKVKVPAIGPSGRITSYFGAILFFFNARKIIQEGYSKVC
jgi:hypothetical protein